MANIFPDRYTSQISMRIEEPFIVLILGIRINNFLLFWKWIPAVIASFPMLYTLVRHRAAGFLGGQATYFWPGIGLIQYWRSFEDLERFARNKKHPHLRAWRWYNKAIGSSGSVGLWHEAFLIKPGVHETMYDNMPLFGLAASTKHIPVEECSNAAWLRIGEEVKGENNG